MTLETEIQETCPFCKEGKIIILEKKGYRSFKTSRGSGVSDTYSINVKGDYRVGTSCPKCGKTKEEIQRKIYGYT